MKQVKSSRTIITVLLLFICATISFAETSIERQARLNPNNPQVLNAFGIELANAGDLNGAIRLWRRALQLSPGNVHLYNNIGSALKRLGYDDYAFKWYAAALEIKPTYWTYYNLALIYRDRGQVKDADWALNKSLALKPDFYQATSLLERIKQGLLLNKPAKKAKAATKGVKLPVSTPEKVATKQALPVNRNYSKPLKRRMQKIVPLPDDKGGQVFLTFDGGAGDKGFDSIVATLANNNVKCTFFLTGQFVKKYPDKARKLLEEGHEIANHSMTHPDMKNFNATKIANEIEAAEQVFSDVLGQRGAIFFRFPFGHQNQRVEKIVESLGYRPVYWHIDTIDWREDPVKTIISRVDKKLRRGAVILMHIGSKNGAKALGQIIEIISKRGYQPARLSDLDPEQLAALP